MSLQKILLILVVITLPIFTFVLGMSFQKMTGVQNQEEVIPTPTEEIACTMEAKICPDGSSVGRVPPDCDFAACPNSETLYACPENNYVNCMPGPIESRNAECNLQFIDWAQANCPGFQGAVY